VRTDIGALAITIVPTLAFDSMNNRPPRLAKRSSMADKPRPDRSIPNAKAHACILNVHPEQSRFLIERELGCVRVTVLDDVIERFLSHPVKAE
jgi:hypothetical protein